MNEAALQQIDSFTRKLAPVVIFAAVTAWFFRTFIMCSDLFWHLAAGRDIWERGHVPQTDPFSYTFGGRHWANHEWLWDAIYWKVYEIGPDAVAWLTIGLIVFVFTAAYLRASWMTGSIFGAGLAVWLAAAACHWFLDVRPHVITLVMVSVLLLTFDRKWALFLWPPLIILWTNLHAGFVFGIGMVGLFVLVRTLEESWEAGRLEIPWPQWASVALCLVAWLVNPYGWRIAEFQLDYFLHDSLYKDLVEWRPPEFLWDPRYYEGQFWWFALLAFTGMALCGDVLLALGAVGLAGVIKGGGTEGPLWMLTMLFVLAVLMRKQKYRYLVALACVAFILATTSRRFIPLFAVISVPFAAISLASARDYLASLWSGLKSPWAGATATFLAAVVAVSMWSGVSFKGGLLRQWGMGDVYPEEAVRYLAAIGPPERLLNYYNFGGLIMLNAPGAKLFIDGRANTLYDERIYTDYLDFMSGKVTPARLQRYAADAAFLPKGEFANAIKRLVPAWKVIYSDTGSEIIAPPDSPYFTKTLPDKNDVLGDGVEVLIEQAITAVDQDNFPEGERLLWEAIERNPNSMRTYGLLVRLYAMRKEYDKLDAAVARALRDNPRQGNNIYRQQGGAYREAGEFERSLEAFENSRLRGPFSNREQEKLIIDRLKSEVERRRRGF